MKLSDPPHCLVLDDKPLLKGLVVLRYRTDQGYGIELMISKDHKFYLPDKSIIPVDNLNPRDRFIDDTGDPSTVTSIRIGDADSLD